MGEGNGAAIATVFHQWGNSPEAFPAGSGVALDGKALASTVQDCHGAHQDYVSIVSACVPETGWLVKRRFSTLTEAKLSRFAHWCGS